MLCAENEIHSKMEMDSLNFPDRTILWSCFTYHDLPPPYSKLKIIPHAQEKGLLVLSKSDLYVSENSR